VRSVTAHTCRYKRTAKGALVGKMSRVTVSLEPEDVRRLAWLADKRKVPVASVLRDAVYAYMLPIMVDADRDAGALDA
jgi:predicted transcriptional regulator